ncbi:MAG TPA: zinc-ribbon domain containing protein [Pyrinomonadaceae bacterium]|nr:zinc-ribbon domain containing protein [Pyrinomonadaceae bacterium]
MADRKFSVTLKDPDDHPASTAAFEDKTIQCVGCSDDFIWSAGEQLFYAQKDLLNPPKRCKPCKLAKTRRIADIAIAHATGKKHRVDVRAQCANCSKSTTVPFYPSQGRPVYCRDCYIVIKNGHANGANA